MILKRCMGRREYLRSTREDTRWYVQCSAVCTPYVQRNPRMDHGWIMDGWKATTTMQMLLLLRHARALVRPLMKLRSASSKYSHFRRMQDHMGMSEVVHQRHALIVSSRSIQVVRLCGCSFYSIGVIQFPDSVGYTRAGSMPLVSHNSCLLPR